ncbi:MAG: PD-(D/E)XK nuclease family protein [Clostridia bacterium]|nr:PD-(D/E)XK nuclease family protein [Clostridia bacterium]
MRKGASDTACTLEFILGRAGTGKTRALFERVRAALASGGECFVIVPEQATFETERRLAEFLSGGLFACTVTSWSGLSRRVLDSLGVRRAFLSPQGRLMLLRRSADFCAKDLTVFRRTAGLPGFPAEMADLISRFKRCGMGAEDVLAASRSFEPGAPLCDKLHDISVVFADCERRCADRYLDPEDMMNEMLRRMDASVLKGAHVFIDGGSTLHEQAYPVFAGLLKNAASVTVALTVDFASRDRELFAPEARAFTRLTDVAREQGAAYTVTELAERKRGSTPATAHAERELFAFPSAEYPGIPEGLSLYIAPDRMDEVVNAAEHIAAAAKGGMRYRDMAVIVSDLKGYVPTAARIFGAYGIPYFTDVKRSLATHPAARLILSALSAAEHGFDAENVLEAVKTGFLPVTPEEAERFENHLLASGAQGKRLAEPFTDEAEELEDCRRRIMEPLVRFRDALRSGSCEERARAVYAFMEELDVCGQQRELCARLHAEGRFREEEENAQVVNTIFEVLDQLYVIMGGEAIGLKRFTAVVKEGFASYEVGMIPTTCDQVLVGSMDRTRSREVKLLIVLGMNDGLFPKKRSDDGVIDDADLKKLRAHGFELWQNTKSLSQSDALTVYSALAMATEEIVFSYPVSIAGSGAMDAPAAPARLVQDIRRVFPLIPVTDGTKARLPRANEELAFRSLFGRLRRMIDTGVYDEEAAELYAWFSRSPEYRGALACLSRGLFSSDEVSPLGRDLAKKLYGGSLRGSASRLEAFNSCPFRHFMQYGMEAKERDERREKATDLGSFYHEALETYVRYVMDSGLDWREIDDGKTFEILDEIIPPIMYRRNGYLLYDTARQRARLVSVLETVRYTCCAVTRHIARGAFRPLGCEVTFGRAESMFPPLKITAGEATFFISGVIDRVDSAAEGGRTMRRIIDYKSGGKDFAFAELAAGLQLQLPLYAAAIEAADTVGMYYMPIRDIEPESDGSGEAVKELTDKLMERFRLSGLSLSDPEVIAATDDFDKASSVISAKRGRDGEAAGAGLVRGEEMMYVMESARRKAAATLRSIFDGEAGVRPTRLVKGGKTACRYCPYGDVCRFDPDLSPSGYRDIYPMSADAFFGRDRGGS